MKRQHMIYSTILILALLFGACVSVNLPTNSSVKAKGTTYAKPRKPFEEISHEKLDKVWLSNETGNTISFNSECENSLDPSLKQIESESISALSKLNIENSIFSRFNSRESLLSTVTGEVDGVPAKLKLIIFKRNSCNYTLTYAGIEKNFVTELDAFDAFAESFIVP